MYQIRISLDNGYLHWFYSVESDLKKKLKNISVMVTHFGMRRSFFAFACENKNKSKVNAVLKESIIEMLSKAGKYTFIDEIMNLPMLSNDERNLLLSALVEFDRDCEKEMIADSFSVIDGLCIDGIYNFRLKELKERWKEILQLTVDNSFFLNDKEIFYELIKFLFSAIKPKIKKLSINKDGEAYLLSNINGERLRVAYNDEQLMCSLIEYAPLEIYFQDNISGSGTIKKLSKLFNLKKQNQKDNIFI